MTEVEVIIDNEFIYYYKKGTTILHREDGPASECIGISKAWYIDGKHHREDGPAIILYDGKIFWYLNGIFFNKKEDWFEALMEEQKAKALYSEYFIRG